MTTTAIQWPKQPTKVTRDDIAENTHYLDEFGDWEIVKVRWLNAGGYGCYWLAIKHFGARRVSRHSTRRAAEAACEE
jgi:hypothetical protein